MTKDNIQSMLDAVAAKNGTTPEEVYKEIQKAINAASSNHDPKVQAAWKNIPHDQGEAPMVEDLIYYLPQEISIYSKRETVRKATSVFSYN